MKLLKPAEKITKQWWVGCVITCGNCGAVYQLEKGDEERPFWVRTDERCVVVQCLACQNRMNLYLTMEMHFKLGPESKSWWRFWNPPPAGL